MNLKLFLLLFVTPFLYSQINLETNLFQLQEFNDSLTIDQIIEKESKGLFNKKLPLETYRFIKDKEANWIYINVPKQTEKQYLSIENSLFEELNFYIYQNNSIRIPTNLRDLKQYRFPLIEILAEQTPCKIFVRSKDALSYRTEFLLRTYNEDSLKSTIQRDYFMIGAFVISMLVLLISTCVFFLYKQQYAILWFGAHLLFMCIEYSISTGTFSQWFISNDFIQKWGLDHMSLLLSGATLMEFYRRFYPYTPKTIFYRKIISFYTFLIIVGMIYTVIDGIYGNIFNIENYAQNMLNYGALLALIIHIALVYRKIIPMYLLIALSLPVLGISANTGNFKELFDNPNVTYFLFQSVYVGILMEVLIILFYIMKKSIHGELQSTELIEENNKLKYNFQENLSINQEKHQNQLLSDVHDSFGGYIEALKLTLINKKIHVNAVDDILSSFTKDYRLLLNSLYVPNVNTENFITAIQEYCEKMNNLSEIDISFKYSNEKYIEIPQNIAKFIFKSSSELTTNAIKYAKPKNIKIELILDPTYIILKIKDNGIGFSLNEIKNTSFGINGIKERVVVFNGQIDIETQMNEGTKVDIKIPIPESLD